MSHFAALLGALCAAAVILAGCRPHAGDHSTPGGIELTMFVRDGTGAESYYEVERDGTLRFGGGMDARLERTSWSGSMSPEEIATLERLLRLHGWYERRPASTNVPQDQVYRVKLSAPQVKGLANRTSFRLKGESPDVQPVRELLERLALRRLAPQLQRLPQPSGAAATQPR